MGTPVAITDSRQSYVLDKLQSLSGIIPIGAFLAEHFWSNSYALVSVTKYNEASSDLQGIPWRIIVEALGIWLPILFHGFYGIYIWWAGKSNAVRHPWMSNWLWLLQRWTGIIAFIFIGWHVWVERFGTGGMSTYADVAEGMRNPFYLALYVIGILAASFHLGNGVWNFACKWGIAVSVRSQRAFGWLGAAVAVAFSVAGLAIIAGFYYNWHPLGGYLPK